jgi:thiopeptide-type bacteriocin biosynthesis protein
LLINWYYRFIKTKIRGLVKRAYIPGDKWLYYKIYCGPKTADELIANVVFPASEKLKEKKLIESWFFIRYADPDLHIRVRFKFKDIINIGYIMQEVNNSLEPMVKQNMVWKIMCDTYQPEVERYHIDAIEIGEQFFSADSIMTAEFLDLIDGDEGEKIRWMFSFLSIDNLLSDFGLKMEEKLLLMERIKEGFAQEFGMNKMLKGQLDKRFRDVRKEINRIMNLNTHNADDLSPLLELLAKRSVQNNNLVLKLKNLGLTEQSVCINELLPSYIHMLMNRLFRSKQRVHELVVYDFICRYYRSELAKLKYSIVNEQKKKQPVTT